MRPDSITLAIFEKYSAEELATTAAAMANAQSDLEGVEAEKKVSDAAFKERINGHAALVSELARKYVKGGETAQIGCDIRYDNPEPGKKSYYRMDRNELVETHDMSWEERQETIQFPLAESNVPTPTADQVAQALGSIPATEEEVTRICPYPGCILFAEHDGLHEFPTTGAESDSSTPEPQPEKESKPRKKRGHIPPPDEPPQAHGANEVQS